jgi:hypothetical protein
MNSSFSERVFLAFLLILIALASIPGIQAADSSNNASPDSSSNPWLFATVGPFLGVFMAFVLNYLYVYREHYKKRIKILNNISQELAYAKQDLVQMGNDGMYSSLRDSVWNSVLFSGLFDLFNPNEVSILVLLYKCIDKYNNTLFETNQEIVRLNKELDPINIANKYYLMQLSNSQSCVQVAEEFSEESMEDQIHLRIDVISKVSKFIGLNLVKMLEALLVQAWVNENPAYFLGRPRYWTAPLIVDS